jgi:WD40 repeat protein
MISLSTVGFCDSLLPAMKYLKRISRESKRIFMHNDNMKRKIFLPSLLFWLLAGCGIVATPIPFPTAKTITSTSILTNTSIPVPGLTPTVSLNLGIKRQCIEINDREVPLQDVVTGGTSLQGAYPDNPFLFDLKTGTRYALPFTRKRFEQGNGISLSPDRHSLAYLETLTDEAGTPVKEKLRVVDARGGVLAQITFNRTDLYLTRWLNNQALQFNLMNGLLGDASVLVFNPFTGEQSTISSELPQLDYADLPLETWHGIEYGSNLDWVVYLAIRTDEPQIHPIIIWDMNAKKILWESPNQGSEPAWSPVSDEVAIAVSNQLYIIEHSGQAKLVYDDPKNNLISHIAWSPDGEYITFRVFPVSDPKESLLVYNTQTGQTIDYCIPSDFVDDTPVWSPDSHQLVVPVRKENNGSLVDLSLLVDIEKNTAYQIPITMSPSIWMNSLP